MKATATAKAQARLKLACEISPAHVIAGRRGDGEVVESCSVRSLQPGMVTPNLTGQNISNRGAVTDLVREAIAAVGARRRDVIVIVPDAAARVVLLDFDELPTRRQDADAMVRFRLKKSLPFDVDRARVSWQIQRSDGTLRVLCAVSPLSVVDEYESIFRDAGYNPGFVIPSTVAALGQVDATVPTMVVNVEPGTTTLAIINGDDLPLYRTLDNAQGASFESVLTEDIYPSVVFFQDTYGLKVEHILVGGMQTLAPILDAMQAFANVRVQELVQASRIGTGAGSTPRALLGGIVGALFS
jgi:type IV pilus assembly protein PilM